MSTVEQLTETAVSSSMRFGDIYVNVWSSAPSAADLQAVADGEHAMPKGYRAIDIVERLDRLTFDKGVREVFQRHAREFAGHAAKNIVVIRTGGFAGSIIHGLVGMFNVVGLKTPVHNDIDSAIVDLLEGTTSPSADVLRQLIEAQIARHVARVPKH